MYEKSNEFSWDLGSNVEFISNISHELRTPLNNILSAEQLLALNIKDVCNISRSQTNFIKYLGSIEHNSYRLQRIIDNFINITDIQLGLCKLNLKNYDIIHLIKTITKHVGNFAHRKGIDIILLTNAFEKKMAFDKVKLEKVILNLLSNAIKYSENNKTIKIVIFDKNDSVLIKVIDQGIGIPNEKLSGIFDVFVQVDKSFNRSREGAGTGLAIAKSFVELHKGTITVLSSETQGSEFKIELPVSTIAENEMRIMDDEEGNMIHKIEIEFSDIYEITSC
ncbi:sensor histidine kinase [Candidatus Clostridium stratigraminis]|uniref:histidine kinase n=1 Tax=Candidatus Clostridium stratigraminis TaxID=3381661 RepID=A0ABW8T3R6_9CLOT